MPRLTDSHLQDSRSRASQAPRHGELELALVEQLPDRFPSQLGLRWLCTEEIGQGNFPLAYGLQHFPAELCDSFVNPLPLAPAMFGD